MKRVLSTIIAATILYGCGASFQSVASKTLNTADVAITVSEDTFIDLVSEAARDHNLNLLAACQQKIDGCSEIAEALDLTRSLWTVAAQAVLAEQQENIKSSIACLLASLEDLLSLLRSKEILLPDSVYSLLQIAITAGKALIAEYGGVCA